MEYRVALDRLTHRRYGDWSMGFIQADWFDIDLEKVIADRVNTMGCEEIVAAMHPDSLFGAL